MDLAAISGDIERVIVTEEALQARIKELAAQVDKDYEGKVYVLEFFFTTCPTICPRMNRNLVQIQEEFKEFESFRAWLNSREQGTEEYKEYEAWRAFQQYRDHQPTKDTDSQ